MGINLSRNYDTCSVDNGSMGGEMERERVLVNIKRFMIERVQSSHLSCGTQQLSQFNINICTIRILCRKDTRISI